MKLTSFTTRFLVVLLCAAFLGGCSKSGGGGSAAGGGSKGGEITIDGSSTVYILTKAVAEEFAKSGSPVNVTVAYAGTGGGFKKFCDGKIDIADASRPISAEEMATCAKNGIEYIELPVCFDALTIAVNPQATWVDSITTDELKKIWQPEATGKVKLWSDVRADWPKEPFDLYGAGDDSGTFEYFTEAIVEQKKQSRSDYNKSENDNNLVVGISGSKYALGYIPYAYYMESKDKLKALKIDWSKDSEGAVEPSVETVVAAKYNPLSRPLFIYVNKKSAARPEVKEFVDFYLNHAKDLSNAVRYIPLPDASYQMSIDRFKAMKSGTGFGGKAEIGLPLEEILKREPKS
jgi:phosphate transport system substrate-binding protein